MPIQYDNYMIRNVNDTVDDSEKQNQFFQYKNKISMLEKSF